MDRFVHPNADLATESEPFVYEGTSESYTSESYPQATYRCLEASPKSRKAETSCCFAQKGQTRPSSLILSKAPGANFAPHRAALDRPQSSPHHQRRGDAAARGHAAARERHRRGITGGALLGCSEDLTDGTWVMRIRGGRGLVWCLVCGSHVFFNGFGWRKTTAKGKLSL